MINLGKNFYLTSLSKELNIKAVYNKENQRLRILKDGELILEEELEGWTKEQISLYIQGLKEGLKQKKA